MMTKKKPNKPVPGDDATIAQAIASRAQAKKMGMTDVVEAVEQLLGDLGVTLTDHLDGSTKWRRNPTPAFDDSRNYLVIEPSSAARDAALELAIQACNDERVEDTGTEGDIAYNNAISHCVSAIRALKSIAGPVADISPVYSWLEQAASNDIAEVSHAARTMMAFYQGAEFPAPAQPTASPDFWSDALETLPGYNSQLIYGEYSVRDYHIAPNEEGPRAYDWSDKPHRLVFDLCRAVLAAHNKAPAQPVGLSEQDRLDAARYRFMLGQFRGSMSIDLDCGAHEVSDEIDAAILAAKGKS